MGIFTPKSKIVLNDSLKEHLDVLEAPYESGSAVYKGGKATKRKTFADLVGDEVYFGNTEDENEKESYEKKARKRGIGEFLLVSGLIVVTIIALYIILKYLV